MKYLFTKRVLLLIVCLSYISFQGKGQDAQESLLPKITPESPNMASLGRYGEYEVSLFTGLPNISIPLFEAKSGSLSVPVTLSYHASGVRVTDQASWVGLGWTLNAGGAIRRTVNGNADESGYLHTFRTDVDGCTDYDYLRSIGTSSSDGQPDVFSYNMPGKSGKFILQKEGSELTIPFDPIKIQREGLVASFDITDENGRMYKFGRDKNGVSMVEHNAQGKTAWMLTQMKAPNSEDRIEFTYKEGGQVQYHDLSSKIVVADGEREADATGVWPEITKYEINHGGSTAVLYPEKIIFENGEIHFIQSGVVRTDIGLNQFPLDRIEVFEKLNGELRKIRTIKFLNTGYFTNAKGEDQALKLDGIEIWDAADKKVNEHRFDYYTNSFSWKKENTNPLYMRDFWGFYNGATINNSNRTLVPKQEINISTPPTNYMQEIGGADRSPNPLYLTEGVLKRITYPTGGYTEFSFGPHRYWDEYEKAEKVAGGLRIEEIKSTDGINKEPLIKTYKYGEGESGYGQKNFFQRMALYYFTNQIATHKAGNTCLRSRIRTYVSSSMEQLNNYDGSPVVYPYVAEYSGTKDSNNGKVVYEFDNGSPSSDGLAPVPYSGAYKRISNHWKRGNLTLKTTFDKDGKKVAELAKLYGSLNEVEVKKAGLIAYEYLSGVQEDEECRNKPAEGTCGSMLSSFRNHFTYYNFNTGVKKLVSVTEQLFDPDDPTGTASYIKKTSYTYNDLLQVTESIEDSDVLGEEIVTKFLYPQDYGKSNYAIAKLQNQHVLTTPVEKYVVRRNINMINSRVTSGQLTTFKINESNGQQVVPAEMFLLETNKPISLISRLEPDPFKPSNTDGFSMDSRYRPYLTFSSYNVPGKLQEIHVHNSPTAYLWGYNNRLPVAEIKNGRNTFQLDTIRTESTTSSKGYGIESGDTNDHAITFEVQRSGSAEITLYLSGIPESGTRASVSGVLSGPQGGISNFSLCAPDCGIPNTYTTPGLRPGTYTITVQIASEYKLSGGVSINVDYPTNKYYTENKGLVDSFFEGFEEDGIVGNAHTGERYHYGSYPLRFTTPDDNRSYMLSYWYRENGTWKYTEEEYSGTSRTLDLGDAIDDVRVHPKDALMTTYTYSPLTGITSRTDPTGVTTYFEYDDSGRLDHVKDQDGNILQKHEYQYQK